MLNVQQVQTTTNTDLAKWKSGGWYSELVLHGITTQSCSAVIYQTQCNSSAWVLEGQFIMKIKRYLSFLIFIGKHFISYLPVLQLSRVLLAGGLSEAMWHWDGGVMSHKHRLLQYSPQSCAYACHTKPMIGFPGELHGIHLFKRFT